MDKKNLIVDAIVLLVYIVVATPSMTGIGLHEWISLGVFLLLFVHVLFHMDWVIATTKRIFKNPTFVSVGNYVLDVLLLIVLALCTVSGILISGDVLPAMGMYADGYYFWDPVHAFSAKLLLALIVVHIVTHLKGIINFFKKFGNKKGE